MCCDHFSFLGLLFYFRIGGVAVFRLMVKKYSFQDQTKCQKITPTPFKKVDTIVEKERSLQKKPINTSKDLSLNKEVVKDEDCLLLEKK